MSGKKKLPIKKSDSKLSKSIVDETRVDEICNRIIQRVHASREKIIRTVDTEIVKNYWLTGKDIVEEELKGKRRTTYGGQLMKMM